jgi:hypothetical protein
VPGREGPRGLQPRQKRVASAILLVGFAAALGVFVTAPPAANRSGERPEDSKRYLRQMETYGGTANVLASEAREWIAGLWQGRALAFTIATLSVLLAALAVVGLTPLPRGDEPERNRQGKPLTGP